MMYDHIVPLTSHGCDFCVSKCVLCVCSTEECTLEDTVDTEAGPRGAEGGVTLEAEEVPPRGAEGGVTLDAEAGVTLEAEAGPPLGAEGGVTRGAEGGIPIDTEMGTGTAVFSYSSITNADMEDLGVSLLQLGPSPSPNPPSQQTPPSTYSIIFDNLDFFVRPHHQSTSEANKSIHWIHHMAVEDRVPTSHLSRDKPTQPLEDYDISKSLPSLETQHHMRREFTVLGTRILTEYMDAFKPLSSVVVKHIPHKYSATMSEASTHVSVELPALQLRLLLS